MIDGFLHRGLKRLYMRGDGRSFPTHHVPILEDILGRLDTAKDVQAMNLPSYQLHPLTGNYRDFWSVRVSGNFRVIFKFQDGRAFDLHYLDYH